jgi:glutathione peroxidase
VTTLYDFTATTIDGRPQPLATYANQVLLVVNTASQCGFTPQYAGLQELFDAHRHAGFTILGFPCDQFGHQEPGDDAAIAQFCTKNFGVTFPMFSKVEVNGAGAHPLYAFLRASKRGLLGNRIKWNFTKFLVSREGEVVARFGSTTKPEKLAAAVTKLL